MALKRVAPGSALIIHKEGKEGKPGKPGKDGAIKVITETITKIEQGEPGPTGPMPDHQISNGECRFEKPDGTWGEWIEAQHVQQRGGGGGPESFCKYILVTQAVFRVSRQSLTLGHNLFGVNFAGDVTIFLPANIDKRSIVIVKDESNNAGAFNITVTTET